MWCVSSRRFINAVKHIRAELRIDQLSDSNSSQDSIIAVGINWVMSSLKMVSLKINFIIFNAWILLSAKVAFFAKSSKKARVVSSSSVFSVRFSTPRFLFQLRFAFIIPGSALKIAMIIGGIPADLLNTVLNDSVVIFSRVLSSICLGMCEKAGFTRSRETKSSKASAVMHIAPRCLN